MFCLSCGKEIGDINKNRICPYCGFEQYEKPNLENVMQQRKGRKKKGLSDEEILALGLYPDDEGYKMGLISRILGRK